MPRVPDELRYAVRDVTAGRMLEQLGSKERLDSVQSFAVSANRLLQTVYKDTKSLPLGVQKQMQKVQLFASEDAKTPPPKDEEQQTGQRQYLLGQFDCLCVPARADFNASFLPMDPSAGAGAANDPLKGADLLEAGLGGAPDCDGASGFGGWFWVVHSAAPNIGESEEADDFGAYSQVEEPPPTSPPSANGQSPSTNMTNMNEAGSSPATRAGTPPMRRLQEDLYVSHMGSLWRCALSSMGRLEVDEAVIFPFGMGAFLRHLGQNDSRYNDPAAMRRLRRRIADELMKAIVDLCIVGGPDSGKAAAKAAAAPKAAAAKAAAPPKAPAKAAAKAGAKAEFGDDLVVAAIAAGAAAAKAAPPTPAAATAGAPPRGPRHVHLCLVVANNESCQNHNSFVEAAAEASKSCRGLQEVLQLRRNVDTLQLAHDLAAQREGLDKCLNVAILNGANRELVGNHWFEDGARFAIDENLHRRSASLARAALLLNFDTEARPRRSNQLADNVRFFGGSVVRHAGLDKPGGPKAKAGARSSGGGLFSCCKRRAPDDPARPKAQKPPPKAKPGKSPKGAEPQAEQDGPSSGAQDQTAKPPAKAPAQAPAQAAKAAAPAKSGAAAPAKSGAAASAAPPAKGGAAATAAAAPKSGGAPAR